MGSRVKVYCPICARTHVRRWLMDVDTDASGVVYPYCKGCRRNVKIVLGSKQPQGMQKIRISIGIECQQPDANITLGFE